MTTNSPDPDTDESPDPQQNSKALERSCGVLLFMGSILVLLMVSLFFFGFLKHGYYAFKLSGQHETVMAEVTRTGMTRSPSRYSFTIDGEEYHGQGGKEQAGDSLEIAYLQDNPKVNRPKDGLFMDIVFAMGVPALLLCCGIYVYIKQRLEQRDLTTVSRTRTNATN